MSINFKFAGDEVLKPKILIFGVGGAGGNAVGNMIRSNLAGTEFVVANTDAQALALSPAENKIQLGADLTKGLGAGSMSSVGKEAAEESMEEIESYLDGVNMIFITAGMGGGTGTGAAPVIARLAHQKGILTVGVVTKPFDFEGKHRSIVAEDGLQELRQYVDTLIVIPNQNLFKIVDPNTTFAEAFKIADDVLHSGVRGVTDLITMPGLINLDFADIKTVMSEMGKAMMGTGEGEGERRAVDAAEAAISNPLLDNSSVRGAKGVLINITGGPDMTLFEVDEAAKRIGSEVEPNANIIFGSTFNEGMEGKIRVSVVATGMDGVAQTATQTATHKTPGENRQPHNPVVFTRTNNLTDSNDEQQESRNHSSQQFQVQRKPQIMNDLFDEDDIHLRNEEEEDVRALAAQNQHTNQTHFKEKEPKTSMFNFSFGRNRKKNQEVVEIRKTQTRVRVGGFSNVGHDAYDDGRIAIQDRDQRKNRNNEDDLLNIPTFLRRNKDSSDD